VKLVKDSIRDEKEVGLPHHLIREISCLKALQDCPYVAKLLDIEFNIDMSKFEDSED
jgi:hypothetical protein